MLALGLAVAAAMTTAFAAYHCWAIHTGMTGTELHKLSELRRALTLRVR